MRSFNESSRLFSEPCGSCVRMCTVRGRDSRNIGTCPTWCCGAAAHAGQIGGILEAESGVWPEATTLREIDTGWWGRQEKSRRRLTAVLAKLCVTKKYKLRHQKTTPRPWTPESQPCKSSYAWTSQPSQPARPPVDKSMFGAKSRRAESPSMASTSQAGFPMLRITPLQVL